ncbi:MAG: toxin-antitoxin system, antitoxin component, Xre family protein [Gemmatimonadetes bacterium]|nr:toxin-antitoxin system, antitoxin component, Xre family protein [Gemmatimonadota bacterium]MYB68063.1 toxin-antitoxin system, antitoxin component, Xre family protein [Gemmatimonadota bacterium]
MTSYTDQQALIQQVLYKLQLLPPERLATVEDFIDFLYQKDRERELIQATLRTAEASFNRVWDNLEDADYDNL